MAVLEILRVEGGRADILGDKAVRGNMTGTSVLLVVRDSTYYTEMAGVEKTLMTAVTAARDSGRT